MHSFIRIKKSFYITGIFSISKNSFVRLTINKKILLYVLENLKIKNKIS